MFKKLNEMLCRDMDIFLTNAYIKLLDENYNTLDEKYTG